jgi:uncharacterized Fe-S cluster protein YjdI
MSEKEIVKNYKAKDGLTVVWKPNLCIHAAECVKRLPQVYNPREKPWIKTENASAEELKEQIKACPSGALSFISEKKDEGGEHIKTKVEVLTDGPLLIHGHLTIKDSKGNELEKTASTAFCRCGASSNKPFCDGSHRKIAFKAD